jgi:hypothetical protein
LDRREYIMDKILTYNGREYELVGTRKITQMFSASSMAKLQSKVSEFEDKVEDDGYTLNFAEPVVHASMVQTFLTEAIFAITGIYTIYEYKIKQLPK